MLAEGIGGGSAEYVTSYTDANMTFDEATWGSMGGAQAWRIDIPPAA